MGARTMSVPVVICSDLRAPVPYSNHAVCPLSGSVIASVLPVAGLAGSLLPFWRGSRLFNSVGPLKAARRLFLPPRFQPAKQPRCGLSEWFHAFLSALPHGRNHDGRNVGNVRIRIGEIRNVER